MAICTTSPICTWLPIRGTGPSSIVSDRLSIAIGRPSETWNKRKTRTKKPPSDHNDPHPPTRWRNAPGNQAIGPATPDALLWRPRVSFLEAVKSSLLW